MSSWIVIILIILLIVVIVSLVVWGIMTVRGFSMKVFGTPSIAAGINKAADSAAMTPKSVTSMTSLMEPQIRRDFPEFVWNEFRDRAETMLTSALNAISAEDINLLHPDTSDNVKEQVRNRIANNRVANTRERFDSIKIHNTEIANYKKDKGKCIITIQSAIQYYHNYEGKEEAKRLTQTKYNMELMYIQDNAVAKFDNAVGTSCPHCGAPVTNLGAKFCEYCGLGVIPINIKVWSLHNFYEVDYNHV